MKLVVKIFAWIVAGIIITLTAMIVTAFVFQNQAVVAVIDSINRNLSTKFEFEKYRLSLIKRFPKASFELLNLTVFSSESFDRTQWTGINTDTLLRAGTASLEFKITDILKKKYSIESITISDGELFLITDSIGGINFKISDSNKGNYDNEIDLDKIVIRNLKATYLNKATDISISGVINNGKLRSRIGGKNLDFSCTSGILVNQFNIGSLNIKPDIQVYADINLRKSDEQLTFQNSILKFEGLSLRLTGYIKPENELLLKIEGQNIDLSKAKKYLPQKLIEKYTDFTAGGLLNASCILSGPLNRTKNLFTQMAFSIDKGKLYNRKTDILVENISFSGNFTGGDGSDYPRGKLNIQQCSFMIGNAEYYISFSAENLKNPFIKLNFSGEIVPEDLKKLVSIPWLISGEGSARLNLKLEGPLPRKTKKLNAADIFNLNPQANIQFKSLSINHKNERFSFNDASGNIFIASSLWTDDLVFSYNNQRIKITGEFGNLPAWLAGKPEIIKINASITADNIDVINFSASNSTDKSNIKRALKMPEGIEADISFVLNNFKWRKFTAANISGTLNYKPGLLNFTNFSATTLDGLVSGIFVLSRQKTGLPFASQGNFFIENIDIKKCFSSFDNFGQDFIHSEHLSGNLSGTLKIMMQHDSLLKPDIRSVNAEGNYLIENGSLTNFEPVKALSKFININELENISFSRLENNFYIKNNYLAIPQMEINSSAVNFTVSGRHNFDNTYEYHVKVYLSELLSGKMKKNQTITDFGAVEDDGLGRTSVFLKITGQGNNIKVSPDLKATGVRIRESLNNEKSNLIKILNEEHGLFKKDTAMKTEPAPRPKFNIEWEETNNVEIKKDTSGNQEKNNILNRIFKKK